MKISESTEQDKVSLDFSKLDKQNGQWPLKKVNHQILESTTKDYVLEKGSNQLILHPRHQIRQRSKEELKARIKSVTILSEV